MATTNYSVPHDPDLNDSSKKVETVGDSVTGHDRPMEQKHPTAPFALVFGVYPIVLAVAVLLMLLFYWMAT